MTDAKAQKRILKYGCEIYYRSLTLTFLHFSRIPLSPKDVFFQSLTPMEVLFCKKFPASARTPHQLLTKNKQLQLSPYFVELSRGKGIGSLSFVTFVDATGRAGLCPA